MLHSAVFTDFLFFLCFWYNFLQIALFSELSKQAALAAAAAAAADAAAAAAAAAAASSESESEIKAPRSTRRQTRGANVRKSKFITGKTYDNESGSETENTFTEAPTPTSPRKRINSESTMKKASSSAHEGPKKEFKQFANGEIAASLLPVRRDLDDLEPMERRKCPITGKSLSEALLFCRTWGEHVVYKNCSECQKQFLYTTCSPQV